MKHELTFILFLSTFAPAMGQENFQHMYDFGGTTSSIQDIHVTDSCYYFVGETMTPSVQGDLVFGKLNLQGQTEFQYTDTTVNEFDILRSSRTQLDTNFRGNLMTAGTSYNSAMSTSILLIKEFDGQGVIVNEAAVDEFLAEGIKFSPIGRLIVRNSDSTYYAFYGYEDLTPAYSHPIITIRELGSMLIKLNKFGDTIWSRRFQTNWNASNKPVANPLDISIIDDSLLYISIREVHSTSPYNEFEMWGRVKYYTLDLDGNLLESSIFNDGEYMYGKPGTLKLPNGTTIQPYFDAELDDDFYPEYEHRAVLACLDSNSQIIWKDSLISYRSNYAFHSLPTKMRILNDTSFAGAYTWYELDTAANRIYPQVRIFVRNFDGTIVWERDHHYYDLDSVFSEFDLMDFELTPDGGFITSGMAYNRYLLNDNPFEQYGYILKTNCLGFMEDPSANFDFSIQEDLTVTFFNTSTNAGSYEWNFGDWDVLHVGEDRDTISHIYPGFGPYTVRLVAYGCNGASDTVYYEVNPIKHEDPSVVTDGQGFYSIFPNPIQSGEGLFVYLSGLDPEDGEVYLDLYTNEGKLVKSFALPATEGIYHIDATISAALYLTVLRQGDKILQKRKLVVY